MTHDKTRQIDLAQNADANIPHEAAKSPATEIHIDFLPNTGRLPLAIETERDKMLVGYCRTSTVEQVAGFEAQKRDLTAKGCGKIFAEQLSSVDDDRPKLEAALDFLREGDTLIVTKLDRLARSMVDTLTIGKRIAEKGAKLKVLDPDIDTSTPIGNFVFQVLGSIAELERGMMLTRQREGIAKAREDGSYWGRKPSARLKADEVQALHKEGLSNAKIAELCKISVRSVYNILHASDDVNGELKARADRWANRKPATA